MGCCGKARANLSFSRGAIAPAATSITRAQESLGNITAPSSTHGTPDGTLRLRYTGASTIAVRGPATGRSYAFSQMQPLQMVDRQDGLVLLRTQYFRQA